MRADAVLFVLVALLVAGAVGLLRWTRYASLGVTDLKMICTSRELMLASANPYDSQVLQAAGIPAHQPLTLPPLLVHAYAPACGVPPYWIAAVAGAALVIVIRRGLDVPLVLAACAVFAGFGAFPWVALGANHAMLEALFVGSAAVALYSGAPLMFALAIGAAAYIKSLGPLPLLLSAVRWQGRTAAGAIVCGLLTVATLFALQRLVDSGTASAYWHAVLTVYPAHAARDLRFASEDNPSPYAFLPIVARHIGLTSDAGVAAAGLVSAAFLAAWVLAWRRQMHDPHARVWLAMLLMAVIVVAHPRVKQYSPFALTPLLAFALARLPHARRPGLIALTCVIPHAPVLLIVLPRMPVPVVFLLQYSLWLVLALAVVWALTSRGILEVTRGFDAGGGEPLNTKGRIRMNAAGVK